MSRRPPNGSNPTSPVPPPSPEDPIVSPDRGASAALAGFLCGLGSFMASVLAALNFIAGLFLIFIGRGVAELGLSSGEVVLVLIAAFPVALVGLILSVWGRRSTSRRRLARAGMLFSFLALVPFFVALVVLYLTWSSCYIHSCI